GGPNGRAPPARASAALHPCGRLPAWRSLTYTRRVVNAASAVDRVISSRTARGSSAVRTKRGTPMATSGRFLTTHVGSLPRPDDLIAMMWAREDGIPVDRAAMEVRVCKPVDDAVARHSQAALH